MGRLKVFLRSICLNGCIHSPSNNDPTYNSEIDVSHLATPHISVAHLFDGSSSKLSPDLEDVGEQKAACDHGRLMRPPSSCPISNTHQHHQIDGPSDVTRDPMDNSTADSARLIPSTMETTAQDHPETHGAQKVNDLAHIQENIYNEVTRSRGRSTPDLPPLHQLQQQHQQQRQQQQLRSGQDQDTRTVSAALRENQGSISLQDGPHANSSNQTTAKLSYDIISVREPLAKILAERQQLLQDQQQRQPNGDHDYIEVYVERGSSCFYEEIAGSVTSSATYDQIGAVSNHNYQALVNAYSFANARTGANRDGYSVDNVEGNMNSIEQDHTYDITNNTDQVDGSDQKTDEQKVYFGSGPPVGVENHLTQSIPVYSVINKANRRSNSRIRNLIESSINDRPPRPPPKNQNIGNHQPSAIHSNEQCQPQSIDNFSPDHFPPHRWIHSNPGPSTSSYAPNSNAISQTINESDQFIHPSKTPTRIPQPPPRLSKNLSSFHTSNRPLPSPDDKNLPANHNNNDGQVTDRNLALNIANDDIDSLNNGYELLVSNLEDDQIDVGYEKIRESNRYSGGSLSGQFCPLQLIDNGGYESVQPIYSSPSLAEPNYEAIVPASASELAAAATAKLTAAAIVIEQTLNNQEQP